MFINPNISQALASERQREMMTQAHQQHLARKVQEASGAVRQRGSLLHALRAAVSLRPAAQGGGRVRPADG